MFSPHEPHQICSGYIHLEEFPKPEWEFGLEKVTEKLTDFNTQVWKTKKYKGLSLKANVKIDIPKDLQIYKSTPLLIPFAQRISELEEEGVNQFFSRPALEVSDFFQVKNNRGVINILSARNLIKKPRRVAQ